MFRAENRGPWIAAGFAGLLLLPWLGSAYHIDEPYFLAIARQILADPLHPFDFTINQFGRLVSGREISVHPPFVSYLLALGLKATGGGEWAMRGLMLPFDLAAAAGLYMLAGRFLAAPLLPTLVILASPGYFINMRQLMAEKWLACLGFWGLYFLVKAADGGLTLAGGAGGDADAPGAGEFAGGGRPLTPGATEDGGGLDATGGRARGWLGRAGWAGQEGWTAQADWLLAAGLLGGAMLVKYSGVVFVLAGAGFLAMRRVPLKRAAGFLAAACAPVGVWLAWGLVAEPWRLRSVFEQTSYGAAGAWSAWPHKLRSLLAFTGGCGAATALWPAVLLLTVGGGVDRRRGAPVWLLGLAASAVVLFLPVFDLRPTRSCDRLLGALLSLGALLAIPALAPAFRFRGRGGPAGAELWLPWAAAALLLQAFAYWSVVSRFVVFLTVPLTLWLAVKLEDELPAGLRFVLSTATLGATLGLSMALMSADYLYAEAQREVAAAEARPYVEAGRKVWFTGHWGFQYYMEREGAKCVDEGAGGWDAMRPGDAAVVPTVNTNVARPDKPMRVKLRVLRVDYPLPLRLVSVKAWAGQGGFYSNVSSFLPFSFTREPLDVFEIVERL